MWLSVYSGSYSVVLINYSSRLSKDCQDINHRKGTENPYFVGVKSQLEQSSTAFQKWV